MKKRIHHFATIALIITLSAWQGFANYPAGSLINTFYPSPETALSLLSEKGCVHIATLQNLRSFDFSADTVSNKPSGGDFFFSIEGGARFRADSANQTGLQDLGDIGNIVLSEVVIPVSGYVKTGVAAVVGHTYVSQAQTGEEGNFIIFRVTGLTATSVTVEYSYQHLYRVTLVDGNSYDFSAHEIMGFYNYGDLYFSGYDFTFNADNEGQRGIISLGNTGNTPLNKLQYPHEGYTRYSVAAQECHTYVALAQEGEEGNYIFFRVQQLTTDYITIDYFYRDYKLYIHADAGPDQIVQEGDLVTLDGSASSDPGSKPLTYKWTAPAGITLSSESEVAPTFTAPVITGSANEKYIFSLEVSNGTETSFKDQVIVTNMKRVTFSGGTGTLEDPWLVGTAEQLNSVRYRKNGYFRQIADIDLGVSPWNSGNGWVPIGVFGNWQTGEGFFTGVYDGGGFQITNLTILSDYNYTGLFGASWSVGSTFAEFKNIRLTGVSIRSTGANTGGIIGDLDYKSRITGCSVTGIIESQGGWVGGIAGQCMNGASVEQSFFNGKVSGNNFIGGVLGQISQNCSMKNCYATGEVTGNQYVGGVCGQMWFPKVMYCYSGCKVTGTSYTGGFAGSTQNSTITSCYWDLENSGQATSAGGVGKTTAQMVTKSTFAGWNFTVTWKIDEKNSYPYLQWQGTPRTFNYPVKHAPIAKAGPDQTVNEGVLVTLDGSASSDPDNNPLTYSWTAPAGITLSAATVVNPSFIAPEVTSNTPYKFILNVSDGVNISPNDTIVVTVLNRAEKSLTINLNTGWNIFSTNVIPANPEMKELFLPLINVGKLVKIQDENGNSLEDMGFFGGWTNNIGDIELTEGYKIKVSSACEMTYTGATAAFPFKIPLKAGWNIMGFPYLAEADGLAVVQQLITRGTLLKVQDEQGKPIEDMGVFGGWQNYIGNFKPGEGYKIKVSTNDTLTIFESYTKSTSSPMSQVSPVFYKPLATGNGTDHMNLYLVNLPSALEPDDEIGIFDGELCVGALRLATGNWQPAQKMGQPEARSQQLLTVSLPISSSDGPDCPGFTEGHPITLKIWKASTNKEYAVETEILKGSSTFVKHESSLISLKKFASGQFGDFASLNENDLSGIQVFPNPTTGKVYIRSKGDLPAGTVVSVVNSSGQQVLTRKLLENPGTVDLSGYMSGIYYVRLTSENESKTLKIILE